MPSKDATSNFGRIGFFLPFILIFLIAADAAVACPDNTSRIVYRTGTVNARTGYAMAPTVITYRGPASRLCGDSVYKTRRVRYVAMRDSGYYKDSGTRYVAVRRSSNSYYPMSSSRYVAIRNVDYDYAPRYVAVRRQPAYVDTGTRYVAVRNYVPRTRYVAVSDMDMDDYAPRYVVVRTRPAYDTGTRYVAVRNINTDYDVGRTRYVAVRNVGNSCACNDELRSSLDQIETTSPRHVVVKTDYLAGTQEVIVPNSSYDDTAYVAPSENVVETSDIAYSNAAYMNTSGDTYVSASNMESPYAVRTYPEAATTGTVNYVPVTDDYDVDDQVILDNDDATVIAAGDIGDACLKPIAVNESPEGMTTEAVSYVPIQNVDDDYAASTVQYVPVAEDNDDIVNADTTYVAADNVGDSCSCPVASGIYNEDLGAGNVSYVPVSDVESMDDATVSYVPASESDVGTVSYVPAESIDNVDATSINSEPFYVTDTAPILVGNGDDDLTADLSCS